MADETTQPRIPLKEAVSIIWLAQHDSRTEIDYKIFCDAVRGIPWDFTDERFLAQIEELKQRMIPRLELDNEENLKKVAEEVRSKTVSKDELEVMDKGLEEAQGQRSAHHKKAHEFTKGAVNNYIKSLKEARGAAFTLEKESAIRNSAVQAAQLSLDTGDVSHIKNALSPLTNTPIEIPPEIQDSISQVPRLSRITEVVLTSGDDIQKGTLVELCLANPDADPGIIADENREGLQAIKMFSLSEDVQKNIDAELGDKNMRQVALKKAAESASQGVGRPIGDIVTAMGWDAPQIKELLSGVAGTIIGTSANELKENNGVSPGITITPTVWADPRTQEKIRQLELAVAQRNKTWESTRDLSKDFVQRSALAGVRNEKLMNDAVNLWTGPVQKRLAVYLETVSVKASTIAPEYFHYFILAGTDVWNTILGGATRRVAVGATKKAGVSLLKKGGERAVLKTAALATGNSVVIFLATAGSKILSFVGSAIKGFASFFGIGEIAKGLTLGQQARIPPKGFFNRLKAGDESALSTALAVILAFAVFIFGSGFTFIRETSSTAAIVAEKKENEGKAPAGGAGTGQTVNTGTAENSQLYSFVQCDPTAQTTCRWPVNDCHDNNGNPIQCCVTEGPLAGPESTHEFVSAIDIDGNFGDPVTAINEGTVISVVNNYSNAFIGQDYQTSIYGNYVDVQETVMVNGVPKQMIRRYAHLGATSSGLSEGDTVALGDSIGVMGSSGVDYNNSHLHLEARRVPGDPNSVADVNIGLPVSVPNCAYHVGECNNKICW